jgi:hypothetical protein
VSEPAKYRKKPVVIEAVQWDGGAENATPIIDWILSSGHTASWDEAHEAWESEDGCQGYAAEPEHLAIHTLEGTMRADPGDWIVRGIKGEFYPVKPDIFAATYEPAEARSE